MLMSPQSPASAAADSLASVSSSIEPPSPQPASTNAAHAATAASLVPVLFRIASPPSSRVRSLVPSLGALRAGGRCAADAVDHDPEQHDADAGGGALAPL